MKLTRNAFRAPLRYLLNTFMIYRRRIFKVPLHIKDRKIRVELAKTGREIGQGLAGRRSLGQDEGMLFMFQKEGYHGFWMKNTLLPLSIAFIDKGGTIVSIADMEASSLIPHKPAEPILYCLEMNKGWFALNGISAGDVIQFPR